MRPRENHRPLTIAILLLMAAILVSFQMYMFREPARVAAEEERDRILAVTAGRELYAENCAMCHGEEGEGVDGPPLNDSTFLESTPDSRIFAVTSAGVPSTEMPAWNQAHGGPLTDQHIGDVVAFLRSWEGTAPDRMAEAMEGDPQQGLEVYTATCVVCHGPEGEGSAQASALNDPDRLAEFDDEWYVNTISDGRPSEGMPTWGTVLSPVEIRDLVALLRAWERGEEVELPGPGELLHEAEHQLSHGNMTAVVGALNEAAERAAGELQVTIEEAAVAAQSEDTGAVEEALERAVELAGASGEMDTGEGGHGDGEDGDGAQQPGESEARVALADLESGNVDAALPKLNVALALASGPLEEAVEQAIADLEAGRADEARGVLENALPGEE